MQPMEKAKKPDKKPVTFKCDPSLLREVDEFRRGLDYPLTLTGFIESAMRRELEHNRDSKRAARR